METEIIIENNLENIVEATKIAIRLWFKKALILIAIIFIPGIITLSTGIREGYDNTFATTTYNDNTNTVIKNVTYSYYHINVGIGAALIVFSLLLLYFLYSQKRALNKALAKFYNSRMSLNSECFININEQSIFYQDFELTRDEKWSRISKYKIVKGYLFLFRDNSYLDSIPIKISAIEKNKFETLMTFIKKGIVEKA